MPDLCDVLWFLGTGEVEGFSDDRILKQGRRAAGRVLRWRQWGRVGQAPTQPNIRMRLRIDAAGVEPYEVKWSGAVSESFVPLLEGGVLDVAIDLKKQERVALDWS